MASKAQIARRNLVARIVRMLETASAETDWQIKWARVNRAAGILVGVVAERYTDEAAAEQAEILANEVAQALAGVLPADALNTMVVGLSKRVAHGMIEFYGEGRS